MNIVVLDGYTANPGDLSWEELKALGNVTVYDRTCPSETVARAAEADVVLTNKVVVGRKEMEQMPHLIYIGVLATGYNVVDVEAAHERGIIVSNVPAYSTESVAQMVFAHLLTVTNRTEHYAQENRNVPIVLRAAFIGDTEGDRVLHLLPPRPPVTLTEIYSCSAREMTFRAPRRLSRRVVSRELLKSSPIVTKQTS